MCGSILEISAGRQAGRHANVTGRRGYLFVVIQCPYLRPCAPNHPSMYDIRILRGLKVFRILHFSSAGEIKGLAPLPNRRRRGRLSLPSAFGDGDSVAIRVIKLVFWLTGTIFIATGKRVILLHKPERRRNGCTWVVLTFLPFPLAAVIIGLVWFIEEYENHKSFSIPSSMDKLEWHDALYFVGVTLATVGTSLVYISASCHRMDTNHSLCFPFCLVILHITHRFRGHHTKQ